MVSDARKKELPRYLFTVGIAYRDLYGNDAKICLRDTSRKINQSVLKASTGSSWAAALAGRKPAMRPIASETKTA